MGFSAKCTLCDVAEDHVENSKLNVTDLRLILRDHITFSDYISTYIIALLFFLLIAM